MKYETYMAEDEMVDRLEEETYNMAGNLIYDVLEGGIKDVVDLYKRGYIDIDKLVNIFKGSLFQTLEVEADNEN